jgi:uncharacterized LabA/DUF88 family protein
MDSGALQRGDLSVVTSCYTDRCMSLFVYIDAENLNNSSHECGYSSVDYVKLFNWLKTKKGAQRVYLYAALTIGNAKQEEYFAQLEKLGYIVQLKEVKEYQPPAVVHDVLCDGCKKTIQYKITHRPRRKANCDSEMTLDIINHGVRKKYSEIIVFSGDGDFGRMYEYVADTLHRGVTVYSPLASKAGKRTSVKLKTLRNNGTIKLEALEGIAVHLSGKKQRK